MLRQCTDEEYATKQGGREEKNFRKEVMNEGRGGREEGPACPGRAELCAVLRKVL